MKSHTILLFKLSKSDAMKKILKYSMGLVLLTAGSSAFATASIQDSPVLTSCNTHTQMRFQSLKGQWQVQVVQLNEYGRFVKIDDDCSPMQTTGYASDGVTRIRTVTAGNEVVPKKSITIGHELGENEDFNTSALLSMVNIPNPDSKSSDAASPTKTCLFYIAAKGPGEPKYRAISLNGAKCKLKNDYDNRIVTLQAK